MKQNFQDCLEALYENDPEKDAPTAIARLVHNVGSEDSWSSLCAKDAGAESAETGRMLQKWIGDANKVSPDKWGGLIKERLQYSLIDEMQEQERQGMPKVARDLIPGRLGLPLHYRFARGAGNPGDWSLGKSIAEFWASSGDADAFWLWLHVFGRSPVNPPGSVNTNVVLVVAGTGVMSTLTLSLVRWPEKGAKMPDNGFVASPKSFGWIVEPDFQASFTNSHRYLRDELGIWPDNLALEWNIRIADTGAEVDYPPVLGGGSAGGAIAVAAGALLAKHSLEPAQERAA